MKNYSKIIPTTLKQLKTYIIFSILLISTLACNSKKDTKTPTPPRGAEKALQLLIEEKSDCLECSSVKTSMCIQEIRLHPYEIDSSNPCDCYGTCACTSASLLAPWIGVNTEKRKIQLDNDLKSITSIGVTIPNKYNPNKLEKINIKHIQIFLDSNCDTTARNIGSFSYQKNSNTELITNDPITLKLNTDLEIPLNSAHALSLLKINFTPLYKRLENIQNIEEMQEALKEENLFDINFSEIRLN